MCSGEILSRLSHWKENYLRYQTTVAVAQLVTTIQSCYLDLIDYQMLEKQAQHFFEDSAFSSMGFQPENLQTILGIAGRYYYIRLAFETPNLEQGQLNSMYSLILGSTLFTTYLYQAQRSSLRTEMKKDY